jgi:YfiH family protein
MIRPPGFRGAAFATANDGDARRDPAARRRLADRLGIAPEWSFPRQVHGTRVVEATVPGDVGEADAVFTSVEALPVAVATADCAPIILEGDDVVAVVHAGWRGAAAGIVPAALAALSTRGAPAVRAAIGPTIGPCCYEVGAEVAARFPGFVGATRWGTESVDLPGYLAAQLDGLAVWQSAECTFTAADLHSFRETGTAARQVAVAWLPAA